MAIKGNKFPNGLPCPSVILGGASFGSGAHLLLKYEVWLSINGAPVDRDLSQKVSTWGGMVSEPTLGTILPAENGDTLQLLSVGHPGPVKAWIMIVNGDDTHLGHELEILPGETESSTVVLSMIPFFEFAYPIYAIPNQPEYTP